MSTFYSFLRYVQLYLLPPPPPPAPAPPPKHQEAPGTTFKKHMDIARGLLSEDDYLLTEILFNPNTTDQVRGIQKQLSSLLDIIERKDSIKMKEYLTQVRKNIE